LWRATYKTPLPLWERVDARFFKTLSLDGRGKGKGENSYHIKLNVAVYIRNY
jgi:hypothetical protein